MRFPELDKDLMIQRLTIPDGKIKLVIDTDAKNEVDDQFAISWALRSKERFDVEAVYAAPFSHECFQELGYDDQSVETVRELNGHSESPEDGMEQSYDEIVKIFDILGEDIDKKVFRGSTSYLEADGKPQYSEAAKHLVHLAMESDEILYVAALGAITNIASAIMIEPKIIEKIVVVWLAGQPLYFGHGYEFNLIQDIRASKLMFECGVPLVLIPCKGVASLISVSEAELKEKFTGKSEIGNYLAQICIDNFVNPQAAIAMLQMDRSGYLRLQEDQSEAYFSRFKTSHVAWSRIIWDISVIAFLKNPSWVTSKIVQTPILENDCRWSASNERRKPMRIATYCHRDMIVGDLSFSLISPVGTGL